MSTAKQQTLVAPSGSVAGESIGTLLGQLSTLLKLRIGVVMMLTALAAMMITPGHS